MDNENFYSLLALLAGEEYSPAQAKSHLKILLESSHHQNTPVEVKQSIGFIERVLSTISTQPVTDTLLVATIGRNLNLPGHP